MDKRLIYILLITIILLSTILICKIKATPNYDEEIYKEVYEEYNEILHKGSFEKVTNELVENEDNIEEVNQNNEEKTSKIDNESVIAIIKIEKINLFYPVIEETTMENLKVAPTKLWGCEPNKVGNFCIIGHNYRDWNQFSKLKELELGDIVQITDKKGNTLNYKVYDIYKVSPEDLNCTSQQTNGKREVTLITCTQDSKERLVIKCKENR